MIGRPVNERTTYTGHLITQERIGMGLSQYQMAKLIGIDLRGYQRLETGATELCNTRFRFGLKLCAILGLDPYAVIFGTDYHPGCDTVLDNGAVKQNKAPRIENKP